MAAPPRARIVLGTGSSPPATPLAMPRSVTCPEPPSVVSPSAPKLASLRAPVACLLVLLALAGAGLPRAAGAVDANVASRAELESIRGIGPAIAARIVAERERGPYADLQDLRDRVRGVGAASLRRMAEAGLRVDRPAGMAGGPETAFRDGGGSGSPDDRRARGWVRELTEPSAQPRRPSSPGMTGW
jgi:hypothetical protein